MTAKELKKIRSQKKLTQVQMAKAIGVPATTYITWENEKSSPNFENKIKIKTFLEGETN